MKKIIILFFSVFFCFNAFTQALDSKSEKKTIVLYTEKYTIPDSNIQATKEIIKDDKNIYQLLIFPRRERAFFFYHTNDSDNSYDWLEVLANLAYETIQVDNIEWNKFCTKIAVLDTVEVVNKNNMSYYYVDVNDFMFTNWYVELVPGASSVLQKYQYLWK